MGVTDRITTRDWHYADVVIGHLRDIGALPVGNGYAVALVWYVFATRPRSVNELAKCLGLHRCTLSRTITAAGLPPLTRLLQLAQALWACRWMAITGEPVSRAAFEAGYPDEFAFSKQLKRITGIRPGVIRRSGDWRPVLRAFVEQHQKPKAGAA